MNNTKSFLILDSFTLKQRQKFYERLISSMAIEAEACYPEGVIRPGKKYDDAINALSLIIRVKGRIHAFYNLGWRGGLIPDELAMISPKSDGDFLTEIFDELKQFELVQQRITGIVFSAIGQVATLAGASLGHRP